MTTETESRRTGSDLQAPAIEKPHFLAGKMSVSLTPAMEIPAMRPAVRSGECTQTADVAHRCDVEAEMDARVEVDKDDEVIVM